MSLSLVKSKRIRSGRKAHVRRVINDANELAGTYDHENPEHRSRAKHYKSTLEKKDGTNRDTQRNDSGSSRRRGHRRRDCRFFRFMDEIDICLTTLEDATRVEAENVVTPPTQANSSQQDQQVDEPGHGSGGGSKVRLPKLQLPSFDGNFKDWSAFWTASIQQLIQISRSLLLKDFLTCERRFEDLRWPLSMV